MDWGAYYTQVHIISDISEILRTDRKRRQSLSYRSMPAIAPEGNLVYNSVSYIGYQISRLLTLLLIYFDTSKGPILKDLPCRHLGDDRLSSRGNWSITRISSNFRLEHMWSNWSDIHLVLIQWWHCALGEWVSSVLCPCQHSMGYMGDGHYPYNVICTLYSVYCVSKVCRQVWRHTSSLP